MGTVYSTVKLLSAKRALQRPFAVSMAVICAHGFFVCQYLTEIMPTIIYWLIVASLHTPRTFMGTVYSTVKLLSAKRALQRPFAASVAVICARAFFV